jgi:hypothetical protein
VVGKGKRRKLLAGQKLFGHGEELVAGGRSLDSGWSGEIGPLGVHGSNIGKSGAGDWPGCSWS